MRVTVKLAGVPPSVEIEDLAVHLNKMLDNPDIGTFRVRELDMNKCKKRLIALDFRSGYDAMYAQDLLHGKEYTLPDRPIVILQAKVTKDPKHMPLDSFDPLITILSKETLHHPVEELSNSSSILPLDNDLPKANKKRHQKSDKEIKSKLKKIEKIEYELLMEKARLQRELSELSDSEDVPPKIRRASDVGSKRNTLVDHFSDSSSQRRSPRDLRARLSRTRRDDSSGCSSCEDIRPKKRRVCSEVMSPADHFASKLLRKKNSDDIDSPTLGSRRSLSRDPTRIIPRDTRSSLSCDPRRSLFRDSTRNLPRDARDTLSSDPTRSLPRDVRDSFSCDPRRSLFRDPTRSLPRDARDSLSQDPTRSLPRNARDSSSCDARRSLSRDPSDSSFRDPKESSYRDWRDSSRDARDILNHDPRYSTSEDLRVSLSCDRKRKISSLDNRHSSLRDPRDSITREFREMSYYDSKDKYSRELSVNKKKSRSRELSITKTSKSPLERSSPDPHLSNDMSKTICESEKALKPQKAHLDAETKVKVEGVEIKSELLESQIGINIRDEAVKDILLEAEKLFNELCAKHRVCDEDKKRVLKNLFDVINERMKALKITSEMGVSCVIMHYRCKYSKIEDNAFLTELFENLVSRSNENETQAETESSPASPSADNIWNIVDAVLQEFELETLEDIKPTIEPPEESETVKITVTSDKDKIKTQYTIHDKVNGYYINIIMDKNRINKFYITVKFILKQMKIHIEKYTNYVYFELLQYVLRGILEKQIANVLYGKEYMKAKAVLFLYRTKYTLEQDGPLVLQTVYDIWEGKYNDEYVVYENNTDLADVNSNEMEKNKEINKTPKETPAVKMEKDNEVNEMSQETSEKVEKVNDISKENPEVIVKDEKINETSNETPDVTPKKNKVNDIVSKVTPAVKVETDEAISELNAEETVNVKIKQAKENYDVPLKIESKEVDKINTTSLNKDPIKSNCDKLSNDDDVLVVESKIEVIDLSDAGEIDIPGDTHDQNVTTEVLAAMATNKTKEALKATADNLQSAKTLIKPSIICLSDNEDDVIECERPLDSKIKSEAVHTGHKLSEDPERVKEETGTVPAEENDNVDGEVYVIDDNDDNASVETLILNEDYYSEYCAIEPNESDTIDQNISEIEDILKVATVHVEVTKISPEIKTTNTLLSNNPGKVTAGIIQSCEERNSSLFVEDVEESIQSIQNFLQKTSHS